MFDRLFSPYEVGGLRLKNRLTMTPLFLGYAPETGLVNQPLLDHYRLMARSGVALVVVENASIDHPAASGSNRELRVDTDECLDGLARLAQTIKEEGALAAIQLNHAGRFARAAAQTVGPSAVEAFGRTPRPLTRAEMEGIADKFAECALRVQRAGFDMVELHGGTGYLLASFLSPRTNRREDTYGGSPANRCRFPVEVVRAVKAVVRDYPVGFRLLAEEWLPGGLGLDESCCAAKALEAAGVAYLSVQGGTHESFALPEVVKRSRCAGYMVNLAAGVKRVVGVPVIAAGRIGSGGLAERILAGDEADLVGLARVLWADPEWPSKVREGREEEIIRCDCEDACSKLVAAGKPAVCARWDRDKLRTWRNKLDQ